MAKLIEGTASMHVNNALTEDEVADGWVPHLPGRPDQPAWSTSPTARRSES